ncbi:MAG: septal ring lytic transglycosylase RlpA family protein [Steroidobacteraceae bacterium]
MGNNGLHTRFRSRPWLCLPLCAAVAVAAGVAQHCNAQESQGESLRNTPHTRAAEKVKHHQPDFSAEKRMGTASFYAKQFAGRPMADGAPMDPGGNNAASKTLPLGTKARVTNLETGKSAIVTIQDRGPYVPGRIVDLSPATARQIGISQRKGVALVEVAPIAVPQPDGRVKLGPAAYEALREAASDTRTAHR